MNRRTAGLLAWGVWVVAVATILAAWGLATAYPFTSAQEVYDPVGELVWSASWLGFGLVGALIVGQRPSNRIGWVLVGITASIAVAIFTPGYGRAAFVNPEAGLPFGSLATWVAAWTFFPAVGLVLFLLLLFPSGELGGRFRRTLALAVAVLIAACAAVEAITPGPIEGQGPPFNPLGVVRFEDPLNRGADLLGSLLLGAAALVLGNFVHRYVCSRGVQRQQFRWMVLAATAFPVLFLGGIALESALLDASGFDPVVAIFFLCGNGLAAAIGVAVTRHGLYEINRVISRAVSYVALTALLAAIYLGAVTVLTTWTTPITRESPIAVAVATLLAAAVFGPARRRIQGAVDRRFNRARYDAGRTIELYRHRLREQVDVDALTSDLLATVAASMQPAGATLWLRGGTGHKEISGGRLP